jgi:uncharacterized protein YuzE
MSNVFEYVAVESKDVSDKWVEEVVAEGKVVAIDIDRARLMVGAILGKKLTSDVEVQVRPF